jgi:L-rhamnose isomerase
MDAYNTDVRPLLAGLREEMGLPADPSAAYWRPVTPQRSPRRGPAASRRDGGVTQLRPAGGCWALGEDDLL